MLEEKILVDYKDAMKARDSLKTSVLSFLRAEFMDVTVSKKKKTLDDSECIAIIRKQIKSRQDSIEQFQKGNRMDLVEKETKEMELLKVYLPKELSNDELEKIIEEAVVSASAQGMKDMGRVMKEVALKVAGCADGKMVSDLVKARLLK